MLCSNRKHCAAVLSQNTLLYKRGKAQRYIMNYESDPSCLDRLQREALTCLSGFPNKVNALNDIIGNYAPEVTKKSLEPITRDIVYQESVAKESNSENLDATGSPASASNSDRSPSRQRISKKKHHRERRGDQRIIRRRPGPLAHILTFLSNSLAACTRATVIKPSRYIANHALTMLRDTLIQRGQLIHVQCGPSTVWSLPEDDKNSLELQIDIDIGNSVKNCIGIMRPAAAQLIADTTKLKRWLQALAVTFAPPTTPLIYAIRKTEAIDGWAYELFFHLKYLQENRIRNVEKKAVMGLKASDEVRDTNLWHRLVQLRDNYIFLYETLYSNDQYRIFSRGSTEIIK